MFKWLFLAVLLSAAVGCGKFEGSASRASYNNLSAADLTPDPELPTPNKTTTQTTYLPVLADRKYLTNLLVDIFGPNAIKADTTRTDLRNQDHGSPCSIYVNHNVHDTAKGTIVEADRSERCSRASADHLSASVNPQATVTRAISLAHACSDLVTNNATLNHALSRIQASGIPAPTSANVLKAYRLFYRVGAEPHKGLLESLLVMLPPTDVTKDHWRVVLNTICSSGFWQAI